MRCTYRTLLCIKSLYAFLGIVTSHVCLFEMVITACVQPQNEHMRLFSYSTIWRIIYHTSTKTIQYEMHNNFNKLNLTTHLLWLACVRCIECILARVFITQFIQRLHLLLVVIIGCNRKYLYCNLTPNTKLDLKKKISGGVCSDVLLLNQRSSNGYKYLILPTAHQENKLSTL